MRRLMIVILALFTLFILIAQVRASQRVALVIGNAKYKHAPALANPLNDAGDLGAALDRLGFKVTRLDNADQFGMIRGLKAFTRAASTAEVALVFYAGHGIEVDKRNFLIPVDARLESDREVEFETVPLDLVSRAVEGASGLGLVILDACRDNPFAAAMKRSGAKRSIGRGLARVEPSGETLVAYAAKGGSVAADGRGRNSPYTKALLAHLEEPGLEVGLMFRKVRDSVLKKTNGRQEPFVYGSLSSKGFYFTKTPVATPVVPRVVDKPKGGVKNAELLFWESVKGSSDPADLKAYLEQFPVGVFAKLARNRLKQLSNPNTQTRGATETVELSLGLKRSERRRIQIALWASGFEPGDRDGLFGQSTRAAIGKWQASLGKARTGYLDTEGAKALLEVAPDLSGGVWAVAEDGACKLWNAYPEPGEKVSWTGACKDGKASGMGRVVWKSARGESTYDGEYRAGNIHGRGIYVWPSGARYEGEWKSGKWHGRGTYTWPNGSRYEGEYRDDKRHGHGIFTFASGVRYEGVWRDGKIHGPGVLFNKSGKRVASDNARNGCFGKRDGRWITSGASAEECGFK